MSFLKRWEIAPSKAAPRGRARGETSGQATVTKKRRWRKSGRAGLHRRPSRSHGGASGHGLSVGNRITVRPCPRQMGSGASAGPRRLR
jgi:hypothetical protein